MIPDAPEIIFHVPVLLRALCYLSAMSIVAATFFWLTRLVMNRPHSSLRRTILLWFARILGACSLISITQMLVSGRFASHPLHALPEFSIILLLLALFMLNRPVSGHKLDHRLRLFALELGKTFAVMGLSFGALILCVIFLRVAYALSLAFTGPAWGPVFALGCLMIAALIFLFRAAARRIHMEMRFSCLLTPLIIALALVMLPDFIEHLANSPKVDEMLHARPRLQRA